MTSRSIDIAAFLAEYWKDRTAGAVRPLAEYLARFPGDERGLAREFLTLEESSSADAAAPGARRISHYLLLEELGRGGQGTVWLAEDLKLRRKVAFKVLSGSALLSEDAGRRFQREAETASRLDHPAICGVYETGYEDGLQYIAMRYVEGESLARRIETLRRAEPPERGSSARSRVLETVRFFELAARALQVAHEAGVLHRDIKPQNLMVTPGGEPVILDFGMAVELEGGAETLTRTGDLFGTPAYMSPEQIAAHRIRLDRRTDVYSLGVALYECLTLHPPFEAPTREALYQAILTKTPPDPRRQNHAVPKDLALVVATALEKDRDRRYPTALELAEDLRRIRAFEPVHARPIGPLLRLARWTQRNPAKATASAGSVLLISTAIALGSYGIGAREAARFAERARALAEESRNRTESERLRLARNEADRRMRDRVLDQQAGSAILTERLGWSASAQACLEAWREFGTPLDSDQGLESVAASIGSAAERDPALGEVLNASLYGLIDVLCFVDRNSFSVFGGSPPAIRLRADGVRAALARVGGAWAERWDRVLALLGHLEGRDPWRARLWSAYRGWLVDGSDGFDALLVESELERRSGPDLLRLAAILYEVRGGQPALDLYDRALERGPDDLAHVFSTRVGRGMAHLATRNSREAREDLEIAAALRPDSAITHIAVAWSCKFSQDFEGAKRAARRALDRGPDLLVAWAVWGDALFWVGEYAEARVAFEKCVELDPAAGWPHRLIGDAHYALEQPDEAIAAYRRCLELEPGNEVARINLTSLLAKGGLASEAAEQILRELAEQSPSSAAGWNHLAIYLRERKNHDGAIYAWRRAIDIAPEVAEYPRQLAEELMVKGDTPQAITAYRSALEIDPQDAVMLNNLTAALVREGELEAAIETGRLAVEAASATFTAHGWLGNALVQAGRLGEGLREIEKGIELGPESLWLLGLRSSALSLGGDWSAAISVNRQMVERDPRSSGARYGLVDALYWNGELEEALALATALAEEAPEDAHALWELAMVVQASGELERALELARRAVEADERNPHAWRVRGILHQDLGDPPAAIESLGRMVALAPRQPRPHALLAFATARSGDLKAAVEHMREADRLRAGFPWHAPTAAWLRALEESARVAGDGARPAKTPELADAFLAYLRGDHARGSALYEAALDPAARPSAQIAASQHYLWAAFCASRAAEQRAIGGREVTVLDASAQRQPPAAADEQARHAGLALAWLEADLAARDLDRASGHPLAPISEHRERLRATLVESELLALRRPPPGAAWDQRAKAHFNLVRATLRRWLDEERRAQ